MTSLYKPITLILEFYYISNGLTFEIFNIILPIFYRCYNMTRTWPVQNFKEISSELADKLTKNMRYRFVKIIESWLYSLYSSADKVTYGAFYDKSMTFSLH